jgi:hypothetical protein
VKGRRIGPDEKPRGLMKNPVMKNGFSAKPGTGFVSSILVRDRGHFPPFWQGLGSFRQPITERPFADRPRFPEIVRIR